MRCELKNEPFRAIAERIAERVSVVVCAGAEGREIRTQLANADRFEFLA